MSQGPSVDVAHMSFPMQGERENGDAALVRHAGDTTLFAVIDGLGHGPAAAQASRAGIERLNELSLDVSVLEAIQAVHGAMQGTRGAAATVCIVKGMTLEVCAVGNVQLMCVNCTVPLILSAGVLGHQVAKFRVSSSELKPAARLALLSDGVSSRFRLEEMKASNPDEACKLIMGRYRRTTDDATVLVADVRR